MKKLLLSLALAATTVGMSYADTTVEFLGSDNSITYTGTASGNNVNPLSSLSKDGVSIAFDKGTGSTAPAWYYILGTNPSTANWRTYANNTFTFTAGDRTITGIAITLVSNFGADRYANLIADSGTISPQVDKDTNPATNGMEITWSGSATSVQLTVPSTGSKTGTPQCQMAKIVVTIADGNGPAAPTITGPATFYSNTATVTMSAASGSTIYYTMSYDGTPADPTTASLVYDEEIVINNTATFKAIAVKDGKTSDVATAVFTKLNATPVSSIAEFLATSTGTVCTFTNPVTVVGLYSKRYLFVKDNTGGLQIFSSASALDFPYEMGQTISGFNLTRDEYAKCPQGATADWISTFPATASGSASLIKPMPIEATAEAVNAHLNEYVVLTGAITKNGNYYYIGDVQLYDRFSLNLITDDLTGVSKDVAGYAVVYNTTPELFITEIGEPNTLTVGNVADDNAPVYGAQGYVVAPADAVIYNMAGVRVANNGLAAGIYLVRHNGTTTKVIVR